MARSPRIAALVALFIMTFPPIAQELVGLELGARAASTPVTALLPNGVSWQDWTTDSKLHAHGISSCPTDPTTQTVSTPGDKLCPLPTDTNEVPPNSVPSTTTPRATVQNAPTGGLPATVPDTSKAFMRLSPALAQPLTVSNLAATIMVTLTGQVLTCNADPTGTSSKVGLHIQVRALPTDNDEGSVIASGDRDGICVAGDGLAPTEPPYKLQLGTSDFHFMSDAARKVPAGQKLRMDILVSVPKDSTISAWSLAFDASSGDSFVTVTSPDALQYAVWTADASDKYATVFPIPQDTASRFSTEGWFAVKDAWGSYDLPPIEDAGCTPSACNNGGKATDAKWQMSIIAPNNKPVVLRDPAVVPNGHEFRACDDSTSNSDDTVTCLTKATNTDDNSAVVYRMPTRPGSGTTPGVSNVWNYTRSRVAQVAPCPNNAQQACGGQFILRMTGHVRDNKIETVLKDSVKFTLGGFGLRIAPWSLPNGVADQTTHTVVPSASGPTSTTFLLDITNLAATADNFTLASSILSASPQNGWSVAFGGRAVLGQNNAFLQGGNHSVLKVTVTAPAGVTSGSASVRVTATSVSAPDQQSQLDLSVALSSTLAHGVSVFVGPEPALKTIPRSGSALFNYTVWNRGTETDSFSIGCVSGPDMTFDPVSFQRHHSEWNGTLSGPGGQVLCVEPNATRILTLTLGPGDAGDVKATLEHNANDASQYHMQVKVQAKSQKDADKSDIGTADAQVLALSSFRLRVLTDGLSNSDDPTDDHATLVMRYGKDDPTLCPNPGTHASCTPTPEDETTLPGQYKDTPVQQQRVDPFFTEFAFYRISIFNDGDVAATFTPNITAVDNTVIRGANGCDTGLSSFDAATMKTPDGGTGMGDNTGPLGKANRLVLRPVSVANTDPDKDKVGGFPLQPGQTAVFYLRVRNEWNRYNISLIQAGGVVSVSGTTGNICDSKSRVEVTVSSSEDPRPTHTVVAETIAVNVDPQSGTDVLPKNVVVTGGARDTSGASSTPNVLTTDIPQPCPPVTLEGSSERLLCRYVRPGENTTWSFTVTKVNPVNDTLVVGSLQRIGGFSLADLRNRGWVIPDVPKVEPVEDGNPGTGDELRVTVTVGVPKNATVADFAGLQFSASTRLGAGGATGKAINFYTVGAQKFAVKLTNLGGKDPIVIHPGDRAAVNLNVSNEGASVDIYNFSYVGPTLPTDWSQPTFEPNETRISPSHNKTVTVFLQSPRVINQPTVTLSGLGVEVHSMVNKTRERGVTFDTTSFDVTVVPHQPDDLTLSVNGLELRPIDPGGNVAFQLNVTNPSPSAIKVRLHRTPDALASLVDGWTDVVGESCFSMNGHETKQVSFTVTAARDANQDTHVTYVLRADLAQNDCTVAAGNTNFAQALARVQVIGKAGLDLQALDPVKVVSRGGSVAFPVRLRNFGTAADSFFFNPQFVNQSQPLPPNPWSVDVRTAEGVPVQNLTVDPGFNRIVFVNLTAPVNLPQLGVRSDLNFGATGTSGVTASVGLTAFVQDYDLRIRIPNATVDAIPGQTLFFTLNMTNAGNGIDTFDIQMDVGGLAGFWNVSSEFSAITLLNGTSRDVQLSVQVPKSPLPTTGAVIGVTVRSRQAESIRPQAEALGLGSPIVALLNAVPKSGLVQVNLYPYVSIDVDGDREPELAVDRNRNAQDGYEFFFDPFTGIIQSVDVLAADATGDGHISHFIDINLDGKPDRFWDPFNGHLTTISYWPDTNNDGTLEFLYDSDGDLAVDRWIDPATHQSGTAIQKDFDDDGSPEFLIDTNGDARPDKYFDPDKGPRGLVTTVQASSSNPQLFLIDTTGAGRPTKQYDRVTGEVADARISGVLEFVSNFWYLVLLFLAVAVVAGYLVVQRRKQEKPPPE